MSDTPDNPSNWERNAAETQRFLNDARARILALESELQAGRNAGARMLRLLWDERLRALHAERELRHIRQRPLYRTIDRLARNAALGALWGAARRLAAGRWAGKNAPPATRRAANDAGALAGGSLEPGGFALDVEGAIDRPGLGERIRRYRALLDEFLRRRQPLEGAPRIVFVIPDFKLSGGLISVVQLANDMIGFGRDVRVVAIRTEGSRGELALLTEPIVFSSYSEFIREFPPADIVVGTFWPTMYALADLFLARPSFIPAYFVQDFEPYFLPDAAVRLRRLAEASYLLTPYCFAKTRWICDLVRSAGGRAEEVPPGLDLDVFRPQPRPAVSPRRKIVLTMMNPLSPYRGFANVVEVFSELTRERGDFELHAFGCTDEILRRFDIPFAFINHGRVANRELPELYAQACCFAEFSDFHGFGRTVAEAMACGTACAITDSGGVGAFAIDGENCLMRRSGDIAGLKACVSRLLDDPALRDRLAAGGPCAVKSFSRIHSAQRTIDFLDRCLDPARARREPDLAPPDL